LGLRSALSPERRKQLRLAGLGHLLAVSGLHVGLVAWLLYRVLRAGLGRSLVGLRIAWFAAALPVVLYVFATGASPSAVRAGLMFALLSVGALWGRPLHPRFVLAAVGISMLVVDPKVVLEYGFWLSFAAMSSIVSARGILEMQWRLFWGLAGLNHVLFGYVSWIASPLNLVAVPVFSVAVLPLALLGWTLPTPLSALARESARPGAQLVLDLAALGSRVDPWGDQALRMLLVAGGLLWFLLTAFQRGALRRWRPPAWSLLILAFSASGLPSWGANGNSTTVVEFDWGVSQLHRLESGWCDGGVSWSARHSRAELSRRVWFELGPEQKRHLQAAHPAVARNGLEALPACARGLSSRDATGRMKARGRHHSTR
jgi:ComEC/Rec2-related protein